jgi:hypothetical protein
MLVSASAPKPVSIALLSTPSFILPPVIVPHAPLFMSDVATGPILPFKATVDAAPQRNRSGYLCIAQHFRRVKVRCDVGFSDATRDVCVARIVACRWRSVQAGNRGVGPW